MTKKHFVRAFRARRQSWKDTAHEFLTPGRYRDSFGNFPDSNDGVHAGRAGNVAAQETLREP
jgi:hypothetical protein